MKEQPLSAFVDSFSRHLVNLLDSWAIIATITTGAREATRSAWHTTTRHTARHSAVSTIKFQHYRIRDALELLLLSLILFLGGSLVLVQPRDGLVDFSLELLLVGSIKLLVNLGVRESVLERVGVGFETILGGDTASLS